MIWTRIVARVMRFYGGSLGSWLEEARGNILALHAQIDDLTDAEMMLHRVYVNAEFKELEKLRSALKGFEAKPEQHIEPIPEEPSAKKRFYRAERERLAMLLGSA